MHRTLKFGLVGTVIIGTLAWLAIGGTTESASYYKTVAEIQNLGPQAKDKKLRVGGYVEAGSISRNGDQVEFTLLEEGRKMRVRYTGNEPLPDTFKDGSQALIDGRMGEDVFHATKIAAKCASKYEAKPGESYKGNAASYTKKS
ncbi:MAG: cytochrome c maturation protein CcmE [Acidobacteria bacterium]|nr:cytochrome c maturation protein CcmE [Acidobacteriota bacterium]